MVEYRCAYCKAKFRLVSDWMDHTIKELQLSGIAQCKSCGLEFTDRIALIDHTCDRKCQKKIPMSICGFCNQHMWNYKNRKIHERTCIIAMCSNATTYFECLRLFDNIQCARLDYNWKGIL